MDLRNENQIARLEKFNQQYTFTDDIKLEVYLDFKRVSNLNIDRLVKEINIC